MPSDMECCKLCKLLEDRENVTQITDFKSGRAFVNFDQTYIGRSMIVVRPHYNSLLDLPVDLTSQLMEDVKILALAIQEAFRAPLFNYLVLGNTVLHAHCHIIPRYPDAPKWKLAPVLPSPSEYIHQHDHYYKEVADSIRAYLTE